MKRFFLLTFIFVFTAFFFISPAVGDHTNVYILGYPRSGNHWVRFCIKKLLTDSSNNARLQSYDPSHSPPYQETETFYMYFGHNPVRLNLKTVDQTKNHLVLILRNYRECIMRHYDTQYNIVSERLRFEHSHFSQVNNVFDYSKNNYPIDLKCYDQWNHKTRFLIYYEDIMQDPEKVLKNLMKFLGKDETLVDAFMENFKELQNRSYNKYENPESRYSGLDYHTSLMTEETILDCDQFMKYHYPEYWDKYLSRYAYRQN